MLRSIPARRREREEGKRPGIASRPKWFRRLRNNETVIGPLLLERLGRMLFREQPGGSSSPPLAEVLRKVLLMQSARCPAEGREG